MKPDPLSLLIACAIAAIMLASCDDTTVSDEALWAEQYNAVAETTRDGDLQPSTPLLTVTQRNIAIEDGKRRATLDQAIGVPEQVVTTTYSCTTCQRHWHKVELEDAEGNCPVCGTKTIPFERTRSLMRYRGQ